MYRWISKNIRWIGPNWQEYALGSEAVQPSKRVGIRRKVPHDTDEKSNCGEFKQKKFGLRYLFLEKILDQIHETFAS